MIASTTVAATKVRSMAFTVHDPIFINGCQIFEEIADAVLSRNS